MNLKEFKRANEEEKQFKTKFRCAILKIIIEETKKLKEI